MDGNEKKIYGKNLHFFIRQTERNRKKEGSFGFST